jgi:beta-lactamase regulating signal transducer with metallopeptidase domain
MIKVSLILLLGLAGCALLRRRSAALRHLVLTTTLVGAAVAPGVESLFPAWDMRAVAAAAASVGPENATHTARLNAGPQPAPNITGRKHSFWEGLGKKINWSALLWIWIGGTAAGFLLLGAGLGRVRWLVCGAEAVEGGPIHDHLTSLATELGQRQTPHLYLTDSASILITYGLLRPRIVLPAHARAWSRERLSVVLVHELTHVRRADWLVQLLGQAFRAVWWFNPLAWIALRRLREESERACDDAVLRRGTPALDYATHLLEIAKVAAASRFAASPTPAMVRAPGLERRIRTLLRNGVERGSGTSRARVALAGGMLAVTLLVGTFGVSAQSLARFTGRVLEATHTGVSNATVMLRGVDSGEMFEVQTDAAGRFEFTRVPFGDYILEAKGPGLSTSKRSVRLNGRDLTRDLQLDAGS